MEEENVGEGDGEECGNNNNVTASSLKNSLSLPDSSSVSQQQFDSIGKYFSCLTICLFPWQTSSSSSASASSLTSTAATQRALHLQQQQQHQQQQQEDDPTSEELQK
jgi:hypothetical protein